MTNDVRHSSIPLELSNRSQWMCYRLEDRSGHLIEIPYAINGLGQHGKVNDPSDWGLFDEANTVCQRSAMDGVGFVFTKDDNYVGVDLDNVVDDSGQIVQWAQDIVDVLNSYSEFSLSGKGIHIIVRGKKPGDRCKAPNASPQFEMYERGRFLVFTGNTLPGSPTIINDAQEAIDNVYSRMLENNPSNPDPIESSQDILSTSMSDPDLIELALLAANGDEFNRLWNGDISDYRGDDSSADLALCSILAFWTSNDLARIDQLFRESALFRDKWDERHGIQTYGQMTIDRAIAGTNLAYTSQKQSLAISSANTSITTTVLEPTVNPKPVVYSDLSNAELFYAAHGDDVHYCVDDDCWYLWTGEIWERDETGRLNQMMLNIICTLYEKLPTLDKEEAGKLLRHIKSSESSNGISGALKMVKLLDHITIRASILDSNPWLLTASNGAINLQTGKLQPFSRDDYSTVKISTEFDPTAQCPRFMQYLEEVLPGDPDTKTFLQRLAGYISTGNANLRNCFMLYGKSGTGKSIFSETLAAVLGDHASPILKSALVQSSHGGCNDRTAVASLWQKRMVTISEFGSGERLDEDLLKSLTGSDTIGVRHLYGRQFSVKPRFKMLFATNYIPKFKSVGYDMRDRLRMVPFNVTFYPASEMKLPVRDLDLPVKLGLEAPGILAWIVRGCMDYQQNGIPESAVVKACTDTCFEDQDPLNGFLESCCEINVRSSVLLQALWVKLVEYCMEQDLRTPFADSRGLKVSLQNRDGISVRKTRLGVLCQGISLV